MRQVYDATVRQRRQRSSRRWLDVAAILVAAGAVTLAAAAPSARGQALQARPHLITPAAQRAIEKAQAYLARNQARDGSWRTQGAYGSYPCAMTALAGLGLLSGGNTPLEGKYSPNVRKAVDFLLKCAGPDGLIASPSEEQRPMYGHGFSMLFLGEVYGMERDTVQEARIRRVLQRAVKLTGAAQSPLGGWIYTPDANGDEGSVTVTQIQGLRAVRDAGIEVPKSIIAKACQYIADSQNPDGGIRYTARGGGPSRPPISAAAVATMYAGGQYENPVALKALAYLRNLLKGGRGNAFSGHQFYALMYCSEAMYMTSPRDWDNFFPSVRDDLVQSQADDGSWQGDGVGPVYGAAVGLIILQLPYAQLPILQR